MPGKLAVFSKKVNHLLLNSVLIGSYYISGFGTILNNIYFAVNFIECKYYWWLILCLFNNFILFNNFNMQECNSAGAVLE